MKTSDIEKFGENCISQQTFEIELSEYSGKVYFVPFAPSKNNPDFYMQIIQDNEVLTNIHAYVPDTLLKENFSSLDAVSFYDVNYDGNTDIILVKTYGTTTFAAFYYGFDVDAADYERHFIPQEQLSKNISSQIKHLSVSEICNFLSDGKKNGSFTNYQEAYKAVSRLYELENATEKEKKYNLIYIDDDDIPELVAGVNGYYISLYTYRDGTVYRLMDHTAYRTHGNDGYQYSSRKNSLRYRSTSYAGAVEGFTYMAISNQHSIDTVAQIETYYFDDINRNRILDENEENSVGHYSISYIDGKKSTNEECESFNTDKYTYIEPSMDFEALQSLLKID